MDRHLLSRGTRMLNHWEKVPTNTLSSRMKEGLITQLLITYQQLTQAILGLEVEGRGERGKKYVLKYVCMYLYYW